MFNICVTGRYKKVTASMKKKRYFFDIKPEQQHHVKCTDWFAEHPTRKPEMEQCVEGNCLELRLAAGLRGEVAGILVAKARTCLLRYTLLVSDPTAGNIYITTGHGTKRGMTEHGQTHTDDVLFRGVEPCPVLCGILEA